VSAQPEFLLRRLIAVAGDEHDLLLAGDWEAAIPLQEEFDETFAQMQAAVKRTPLGTRATNDLTRLRHLHGENMALLEALRDTAGEELAEIGKVRHLKRYAPLGTDQRPTPQYFDGSA